MDDASQRAAAKDIILLHAFAHADAATHPKAETGFLGSLRPYRGRLDPENYHEVVAALMSLAPTLREPLVDRELVAALWSLVHLARSWALDPEGMLPSNGLIRPEEQALLRGWLDVISYATMVLLDGGPSEEAFVDYEGPEPAP